MKQIIFKVPEFPHLSETFIVNQIVMAINLNYNVRILVSNNIQIDTALLHPDVLKYALLSKIFVEDYKIPQNKFFRFLKWIVLLLTHFPSAQRIEKFHQQKSKFSLSWLYQWVFYHKLRQTAIFHVQYGTKALPLAELKKCGYVPKLIVTFHGHDAFFPINGFIQNDGYYDNLFKYADLITANTKYLTDALTALECNPKKITTIPVGVDMNCFLPQNSKDFGKALKLITVGRLDAVKGHAYCIHALNSVMKFGIPATLTIVGAGSEEQRLKKLIISLNLEKHVFLVGSKSSSEVRALLQAHDIYLLAAVPLPDGRRESQGLATIEAQACGLPAIVFDSGGVKYTVDDKKSGFVCKEYDVAAMAEKIVYLHENRNLLKDMSTSAVQFVTANFSQSVLQHKWKVIYENTLNE